MNKQIMLVLLLTATLLVGCVEPDGGPAPSEEGTAPSGGGATPSGGGAIISKEPVLTTLLTAGFKGNSYALRVSKLGYTVYLFDSDGDGTSDSVAVHQINGARINTLRLTGPNSAIGEGAVLEDQVIDVNEDGTKVVFIARLPTDRDEYAGETPLEEHMRLGGQSHIAVSDDGIVTGTTVGGKIFVGGRTLDFEPWLDVKVSSDGQRVLATDWNDGLYTFNTETEEKKEVSPPLGGDKNYWVFDMGSTGGPIVYYVGETGGLVHMLRFDEP